MTFENMHTETLNEYSKLFSRSINGKVDWRLTAHVSEELEDQITEQVSSLFWIKRWSK
jgi:hypothetical protein